jgi:hypothetical protein
MNGRWAAHTIRHAADQGADVVVQLGDYGYTFDAPFLSTVDKALADTGLHLLFVDGNHECFPTLNRYPIGANGLRQITDRQWHLPRGFRWQWAGAQFLACGGAHSVDRPYRTPGVSWWPDETISAVDVARCVDGGPADVLISHDCPTGVTIPGIDDRTGPAPFPADEIARAQEHRAVLRQIVDATQPAAIFHGHYHRYYERHPNLGYGPVHVVGLDCDGTTLDGNVLIIDMDGLQQQIEDHRQAAAT